MISFVEPCVPQNTGAQGFQNGSNCLEAALSAFGRGLSTMYKQGLGMRSDEEGIAYLFSPTM
jgi:hypothetical protein